MSSPFNDWLEACDILGFTVTGTKGTQTFKSGKDSIQITASFLNNACQVTCRVNGSAMSYNEVNSVSKFCKTIDKIHNQYDYSILSNCILTTKEDMKSAVTAAINTRDIIKNLVRVKSSNVWSVGINIRDRHDKFGEVLAQFKDKNGGPGDIYIYYDVPIRVYRRWQTATSKGHYFWQYIRNYYKYSKLTGDKRGKLPNAINN